ncbi:HAMP domain-containing protein [Mariprofundus sp. EBB-1]|uniref:ATP-binding protein n=1 Tax=Mariprofundus sp. EBB-1 TaxID=2650971 RepID=UPI000EF28229|nr:ATP-binding protein [Mariprofundus sp. EBB-1]RLL55661.1 HAMP domain-containing protein [Mariprofundus sp. EBB-1]
MRLFWKVFLLLLCTLLITAAISNWLGEKWRGENQLIESRLTQISSMGETAVSLFEAEGAASYQRWLRHDMRSRHGFGALINSDGVDIRVFTRSGRRPPRPLPEHLTVLIDQAQTTHHQITLIEPPRLALALPLQGNNGNYVWVASTMLSPDEMRQTGSNMKLIQLLIALFTITAVSMLLTRMLTRPIRSLQTTSEQLGHGELNARVEASVTKRNDELGDLALTINQMADRLDALINSHKQLLRDISHELRSPLARLEVALELARNEAGGKADAELDRIGLEADRINQLIGEVLTLARFEQGGVNLEVEALQLDEVLDEIIADACFEARTAGKEVNWDKGQACSIQADHLWIARAFDNVIRNAIRYTENSVDIAMHVSSQSATILIRDHGPGVPETALPQLFEPFFRVSDARERDKQTNSSGYGLGLAIASRAIALQHGTIHATNHPEGGLQIEIELPFSC